MQNLLVLYWSGEMTGVGVGEVGGERELMMDGHPFCSWLM